MGYRGFYKRRRGILEHLESGKIDLLDSGIHDFLCLKANPIVGGDSDWPPGVYIGSAESIRSLCQRYFSDRAVRRSLEHLEKLGWIKRWMTKGKRGNYPILIARFTVADLSGNEYTVNAEETTDWKHPKLEPIGNRLANVADPAISESEEEGASCHEASMTGASARNAGSSHYNEKERTSVHDPSGVEAGNKGGAVIMTMKRPRCDREASMTGASPSDTESSSCNEKEEACVRDPSVMRPRRGREGAAIGELRIKNKKKNSFRKSKKQTSDAPALFVPARDYALEAWKGRFGHKPTWGPKDFVQLSRLLRIQKDVRLEEFKARWDRYLNDHDEFIAKQGYSLAFFCSRFDAYIERGSGLDYPEFDGEI